MNFKEITSKSNLVYKELLAIKNGEVADKFLIEGDDLVSLAFANNSLDIILCLVANYKYPEIPQLKLSEVLLTRLSNYKSPPAIIAVAHLNKKSLQGDKLLYLDNIQDPGNVGTMIRTALSFSYSAVILGPGTAKVTNSKVIQASKGAIFKIPVFDDIALSVLKDKGYKIIATALHNAENLSNFIKFEKEVIVMGNEGQGISEENLALADKTVKIEMDGIDSLNVAVACGIVLYSLK